MKSETAIKVPTKKRRDDPFSASLRERLLRGTAARLCPPLKRVPTYPVIVSGEVDGLSEIARVQNNMARWMEGAFGPLYVVYLFILSRFGLGPLSKDKMAAFDAIMSDAKTMAENAKFWQAAVERMFAQAKRARAKGREFTPPDWFIWLDRYDLSIAPARVKSLMAALSVKGRVAVMGLVSSLSSSFVTTSSMSPQDEARSCAPSVLAQRSAMSEYREWILWPD